MDNLWVKRDNNVISVDRTNKLSSHSSSHSYNYKLHLITWHPTQDRLSVNNICKIYEISDVRDILIKTRATTLCAPEGGMVQFSDGTEVNCFLNGLQMFDSMDVQETQCAKIHGAELEPETENKAYRPISSMETLYSGAPPLLPSNRHLS